MSKKAPLLALPPTHVRKLWQELERGHTLSIRLKDRNANERICRRAVWLFSLESLPAASGRQNEKEVVFLGSTVVRGHGFGPQRLPRRADILASVSALRRSSKGQHPAYNASKAAVLDLTRQLAVAFGPQRINVNAVCPGFIATAITRPTNEEIEQWRQGALQGTPWPRIGTPKDVASCVLFLSSPEAEWVTGAILPVDGGVSAK